MRSPSLVIAIFGVGSLAASALGHPHVGMFLAFAAATVLVYVLWQSGSERADARRRNARKSRTK